MPGHACKQPTGSLLLVCLVNPVILYLYFFGSDYLSGVPVS